MADKVKIEAKIITINEGRVSFFKAHEATYRRNKQGQEIKTRPDGSVIKPQYRMTWLLDPSNAQAAATIKEIKEEAARQLDLYFNGRENWPKDNPTTGTLGIIKCFGEGNKLPKVYDGYKDMFYIKVADTERPILGTRDGREVRLLSDGAWHIVDKKTGNTTEETVDATICPYGGCYGRGRISLYVYNNESAGVNSNFRGVQFLKPGDAFGGQGKRNADEEFAALGEYQSTAGAPPADDPFG